jgi:hypothetical protein
LIFFNEGSRKAELSTHFTSNKNEGKDVFTIFSCIGNGEILIVSVMPSNNPWIKKAPLALEN